MITLNLLELLWIVATIAASAHFFTLKDRFCGALFAVASGFTLIANYHSYYGAT